MTLLEILDTSIKIGLGALVTGVIAYFNQKASISASVTKENLLYNRNLLTNISKDVEEINPAYIEGITFHYVDRMKEVLDIALV